MTNSRIWRIKGARILDPASEADYVGDVCAMDGRIVAKIPNGVEAVEFAGDGMIVVPGLIDRKSTRLNSSH